MKLTFFESKFRLKSKDEARRILTPLKLGRARTSNVVDTYLVSDQNKTKKIYECEDGIYSIEVLPVGKSFVMSKCRISPTDKENILKSTKVDKILVKTRKIWNIGEIEIAIDKVKSLRGYFIEIQGSTEKKVKDFLLNLGINKNRLLTKPYNQLQE